jgi:hypothetical protein
MKAVHGAITIELIATLALLAIRCTSLSTAGGSEIGNPSQITVTGQAVYESSGIPVAGADVRIRSRNFCKDTTRAALTKQFFSQQNSITDRDGRFVFDSVDTGDYIIEVNDGKSNAVAIPCAVHGASTVKALPVETIRPTASVSGVVVADGYVGSVYAQIVGLDRVVRVDSSSGMFIVRDAPPGSFDIQIVSSSPAYEPVRVGQVTLVSGATTHVDTIRLKRFSGWSHVRQIILNTSSAGANVSDPVVDFPVLIRLTPVVFDFTQVQADGGDLRFAKPDSTPLPFEIEMWDRFTETAAIWVRVDTVYGNDSTQSILMFWGNPGVESASNGAAVFARDNGYVGVWHLDDLCRDATANRYNGLNYGADDVAGIIGRAKRFDGGDSIRIDGLLGQPAGLTLSGWVMTDTTIASGQEMVTLGDAVFLRADEVVGGYGTGGYVHRYTRNGDTAFMKVTTGMNVAQTGWRHLAFTFDSAAYTASLYIDGEPVRIDNSGYAIDYTGVGSNTFIGAHGNGKRQYNSRGSIDEVRVDRVVRSPEWIRLCFMNQRPDDRLVVVK